MKKLIIFLAGAIVGIALVVSLASMLFSSSAFVAQEGEHVFEYSAEDKELYILYNGEVIDEAIECNDYDIGNNSLDKSVTLFAVTVGEDDPKTTDKNEKETKYYVVDKTDLTELPEPDEGFMYKELSADGKTVYCKETKKKDDGKTETTYYLYNISGEEKTELKFEGDYTTSIKKSPNFESFLYVSVKGEGEEITEALYLYADGENTKLGSDMDPVLVSDDAKYVYASATQKDNSGSTRTLYYFDDGEKFKIKSDFSEIKCYNEDASQILFSADGKIYFYENGEEEAVKIANGNIANIIKPAYTVAVKDLRGVPVAVSNNGANGVYVISDDPNEIEKIASDISSCQLTEDGKTLYYTKKDTLRRVEINDASTEETLAEADSDKTTLSFYMSKDGSNVYYKDIDTLYHLDGPKEKTRVSEDVASVSMTSDDLLFYVAEDYILYATDSDDKGDKIDDDVCNIVNYFGTTLYFADYNAKKGAATAFYSDGGDSFENVKSGKEFKTSLGNYYTPVSNVTPNYDSSEVTTSGSVDYGDNWG